MARHRSTASRRQQYQPGRRQFHVERFVNKYVQGDLPAAGMLSFTSEAIENIPAGWRARETYVEHGPDEVEKIFELSGPEQTVRGVLPYATAAR